LLDQGAEVLVTDLASEEELHNQLSSLDTHPNLTKAMGQSLFANCLGRRGRGHNRNPAFDFTTRSDKSDRGDWNIW
jgi:hypothetical protein